MKVNVFIKQSKAIFDNLNNKLRIVIGNQAADLDSIVSAISYSYYLNQTTIAAQYIPIINSSKQLLATKKPCVYMFEQMSIDLDDLIYISDLARQRDRLVDVVLVDHNELDRRERDELNLGDLVRAVVDHHLDKGAFGTAQPRLIDTRVGSNASLIVDMFRQQQRVLDASFATMMLYPILFDTNNLTQLTHQLDVDAVAYLRSHAVACDTDALFAKLDELKFTRDENERVDELLRQDYKLYDGRWAMSSVTFCLAQWIGERNNLAETVEFVRANDLVFYGLLSIFRAGPNEHRRDLILVGNDMVIKKFVETKQENLSLAKIDSYQTMSYALFNVKDVKLTRKYWQPLLNNFLKDLKVIR